ncbi:putative Subtilisin inhibitor 1 [Heracleum sosnowskyi]|uniref:Subtilisin inhibitor 1 n=1 Tax=Heracleum sosnowskyi TaxID=360622 RepID=A0AAD8J6S7_9APIA|nr:putative Subtilisin inhibitor 1 [Heracleum sosnowskyi]
MYMKTKKQREGYTTFFMAEEDNKAAELPQEALPRSLESLLGGNHSRKTTWPEVVGMTGEEAKKQIEEESPGTSVHLIPQNTFVTMDYRTNRVRLYIDSSGKVAVAPKVG